MDDLMARTMIENLSIGIHPLTGEVLSKKDACANEIVQEALKTVLEHCSLESYATMLIRQRKEKEDTRIQKKEQRLKRYPNQGKPWTHDEERKLRSLCSNGYPPAHIANILKRSPQAIRSHIKKLALYNSRGK